MAQLQEDIALRPDVGFVRDTLPQPMPAPFTAPGAHPSEGFFTPPPVGFVRDPGERPDGPLHPTVGFVQDDKNPFEDQF